MDEAHHWQSGLEHVKVLVAVDLLQNMANAKVTAKFIGVGLKNDMDGYGGGGQTALLLWPRSSCL